MSEDKNRVSYPTYGTRIVGGEEYAAIPAYLVPLGVYRSAYSVGPDAPWAYASLIERTDPEGQPGFRFSLGPIGRAHDSKVRICWVAVTDLYNIANPPSVQKTPSQWNGTCLRCGRNTYTSCFNVEHEGGDCQ